MATPIEGGEVQGDNGPEIEASDTPGLNPAWGEALSAIPEQFHQVLTPHFQKWDQEAQQRVTSVNEQMKAFEPYKPFIDEGISAEDVEQGLQFMYQLNANPQAVYQALAEAYGYGAQPNPEAEEDESEEEAQNFQDPRFDELQQGLDLVAQTILQQQQQKLESEAEAQIDAEVSSLKESHPGIPDEFIYSLMTQGFDTEFVGQKWNEVTQNILQTNPRPFAPQVLGSSSGGAGLPSQAIDPKTLGDKETRSLVVQMLNAANQGN